MFHFYIPCIPNSIRYNLYLAIMSYFSGCYQYTMKFGDFGVMKNKSDRETKLFTSFLTFDCFREVHYLHYITCITRRNDKTRDNLK